MDDELDAIINEFERKDAPPEKTSPPKALSRKTSALIPSSKAQPRSVTLPKATPPAKAQPPKTASPQKAPHRPDISILTRGRPAVSRPREEKYAEPVEEITVLEKLFKAKGIRICGSIEKLRAVASDVGDYIGDVHYNRIITRYSLKYMEILPGIDSRGQRRPIMYLTEEGIYKYLMQSKLEAAEEFQEFVFDLIKEERKRTVDSIQLALKIAQAELEDTRREKAFMGQRQEATMKAANDAREYAASLKKENKALQKHKNAAADAEEMRLMGRGSEQVKGWNC